MAHRSVLLQESLNALALEEGMTILDGTFGAGGHSRAIAERIGLTGTLIALDRDREVFSDAICRELGTLTRFIHAVSDFRHAGEVLDRESIREIDGALLDLGLSSTQLESSGRGFTFQKDEPLLMTFEKDPGDGTVTAMAIVNRWDEEDLTLIFREFAEERYAPRIARAIANARDTRPIATTAELVDVIRSAVPAAYRNGKIHPATRVFQALRMAVNGELNAVMDAIPAIARRLRPGGRLAVISFHSVEDRVVKRTALALVRDGLLEAVAKKPIAPTREEVQENPRARSAKLRIYQKHLSTDTI